MTQPRRHSWTAEISPDDVPTRRRYVLPDLMPTTTGRRHTDGPEADEGMLPRLLRGLRSH